MSKQHQLVIATRESPLALWQANWVKTHLQMFYPKLSVELLGITTEADRKPFVELAQVGGKGLFVKELEEALLAEEADIAVHSMKDVPMDLPEGLCLEVMCVREDPRDVFLSNQYTEFNKLPSNATIGTSSLRRKSQLHVLRSDIQINNLRGNVNTRLLRLDAGDYDAIVLAAAGIKRLGLENRIRSFFSTSQLLPAPGQGVLGIECRADDVVTKQLINLLNHMPTQIAVTAERALCKRLGGGCHVPLAAFAEIEHDKIKLSGLVARVDGSLVLRAQETHALDQAQSLGIMVAEDLLRQGAEAILQST